MSEYFAYQYTAGERWSVYTRSDTDEPVPVSAHSAHVRCVNEADAQAYCDTENARLEETERAEADRRLFDQIHKERGLL